MSTRLSVDWIACDGRGLCAELAPELVEQDEWGFPVVTRSEVPAGLVKVARRAVRDCPVMALRLVETPNRAGVR